MSDGQRSHGQVSFLQTAQREGTQAGRKEELQTKAFHPLGDTTALTRQKTPKRTPPKKKNPKTLKAQPWGSPPVVHVAHICCEIQMLGVQCLLWNTDVGGIMFTVRYSTARWRHHSLCSFCPKVMSSSENQILQSSKVSVACSLSQDSTTMSSLCRSWAGSTGLLLFFFLSFFFCSSFICCCPAFHADARGEEGVEEGYSGWSCRKHIVAVWGKSLDFLSLGDFWYNLRGSVSGRNVWCLLGGREGGETLRGNYLMMESSAHPARVVWAAWRIPAEHILCLDSLYELCLFLLFLLFTDFCASSVSGHTYSFCWPRAELMPLTKHSSRFFKSHK